MATAKETITNALAGHGCLGKAADNEPVFVLRAQDLIAPQIVDKWAGVAKVWGCPEAKTLDAKAVAQAMRDWQAAHPETKAPD